MRRVVTGHDASGKSVFVSDGEPPHGVALRGVPRFRIDEVLRRSSAFLRSRRRAASRPPNDIRSFRRPAAPDS